MKLRWRLFIGVVSAGALVLLAALFLPRPGEKRAGETSALAPAVSGAAKQGTFSTSLAPARPSSSGLLSQPRTATTTTTNATVAANAPSFPYRLSNTTKSVDELSRSDDGLLLANALIDTRTGVRLPIPDHLRASGDPGAYVVQSRGPLTDAFRQQLAAAGATLVAYIPNNAYLVRVGTAGAQALAGNPATQAVLPFAPYFKLAPDLLKPAVEQTAMPAVDGLILTLFPDALATTLAALKPLGVRVVSEGGSPFGPVLTVQAPDESLPVLARLPGVQGIEKFHPIVPANDLSRARMFIATNTVTTENWLGLTGAGVVVNVTDTGVDAGNPDLAGRVIGDTAQSLQDTNGHGTVVAGIIASSGANSPTVSVDTNGVSNIPGSVTNANFRGKAPGAKIFSMVVDIFAGPGQGGTYFQETAGTTNIYISNNSWSYGGANGYTIGAASYDAAVRDVLPRLTGSQPMVFVFPAGNSGAAGIDGLGGDPGSVLSPGTAKNVITVGAVKQLRFITNGVVDACGCVTNQAFLGDSDSENEVASFSSRGNVNPGIEGTAGRFKPDLVAPGTFVVSTRSRQWDTNAYYNPTNFHDNLSVGLIVQPNSQWNGRLFIPPNAVAFRIAVSSNATSTAPLPDLPIFVKQTAIPTNAPGGYDGVGTNQITVPPAAPLTTGVSWFYSVGNTTTQTVTFDVTTVVVTTNDNGDYFDVLRKLNDPLGPDYRYESGTSMAAADVSGMLALMQEFFEQRLHVTNSPAMMKALLINGARSVGIAYDFRVGSGPNHQGWGIPLLPTVLPSALAGGVSQTTGSLVMFDQNPTNALATGQSQTRKITLTEEATGQPLRFTLVWTDPPGNPAASIKLVNDLDLIVTNLDTGDVFYGNDIPSGSIYSEPWATNAAPVADNINNVENVFLPPFLSTNYSVTVSARRVNVNAVTAQSNNVVQDYALVISSGDGQVTNALTLTEQPVVSVNVPQVTFVPAASNGIPFMNQIAGANSPLIGTNFITNIVVSASTTNFITLGVTNQWHFYVVTNTFTGFTNAAFVTFLPSTRAVPRIGVRETDPANATRAEADIDLYVSTNPALTNLDAAAILGAEKSLGSGGTETVVYTNSTDGQVFYVGVKSEDHMAAEYGFVSIFSLLPFGQDTGNGIELRGVPVPAAIPDGSPEAPGAAMVFAICAFPAKVGRVTVTSTITHENFGDLLGNLSHNRTYAVLNNHDSLGPVNGMTFNYDDFPNSKLKHSDGPGSLTGFLGQQTAGAWILSMVDNAPTATGQVDNLTVKIQKQPPHDKTIAITIPPNDWFFDFIDVPMGATNLTITIANTNGLPLSIYIRKGDFPTLTVFDKKADVAASSTNSLTLTLADSPPLSPGRWFIGVYNPNSVALTVDYTVTLLLDLGNIEPAIFESTGKTPILDDAVSTTSLFVATNLQIAAAEVGVRIDHPRVSDLALTLISPTGKRILLAEDRGGWSTNGYGATVMTTNFFPTVSGTNGPQTNVFDTHFTSGLLLISCDFTNTPNALRVYYQNNRIFDSGTLTNANRFTVPFGPGAATQIAITMNENGATNSLWQYTVQAVSSTYLYTVFTGDTNRTTTPIKFALPPLAPSLVPSLVFSNSFEAAAPGDVTATNTVDGWTVLTNQVTVIRDPNLANTGSNLLALANGAISNNLPTTAGRQYTLSYAYRGPGIISWWRGENNASDSVDGNSGNWTNGVSFAAGVSGQSFGFDGTNQSVVVSNSPSLNPTNAITLDAWVYPARIPTLAENSMHILSKDGESVSRQYLLTLDGQQTFRAYVGVPGGFQTFLGSTIVQAGRWYHIAMTYDGATLKLFVDGQLDGSAVVTGPITTGIYPFRIGGGNPPNEPQYYFAGKVDEASIYNRALSASEIKAIYSAGTAGKFDPAASAPQNLAEARVTVGGVTNVSFGGNTNWQTATNTFTATQNGTPLRIGGIEPGMLLDTVTLAELPHDLFYLPEQSLDALVGDNANGRWQLEVWDTRVGAAVSASLVSWELRFTLTGNSPPATPLLHGTPVTNTIAGGQLQFFSVDVPLWAQFATNRLLRASAPVILLFNQNILPSGTNAGDFVLLNNVTNGSVILSTNSVPPLVPGQRYYLGVQNPGGTPVTCALEVDFDITPLSNAVPVVSVASTNYPPRYFQYDVTTNAATVLFALTNLSGNVDLVARKGLPVPDLSSYDYLSAQPGVIPEMIFVSSNSAPVPLSPGRWFLGVFNHDVTNVTYTIVALELTNRIVTLENAIPVSGTNSPAGTNNAVDYYRFVVSTNAVRAQFEINNPSGPVALAVRRGYPPLPDLTTHDYLSANGGTNDDLIVVFNNSAPVPLAPGDWFLSAVNLSGAPLTYSIKATEWAQYGTNLTTRGSIGASNTFCLTWNSLIGAHYFVQGVPDLNTTNWTALSPTITAVNTQTTWCVSLPTPFHFFRVQEGVVLSATNGPLKIDRITVGPGGYTLHWTAPADQTFHVQWAAALAMPTTWNTFTNVVTSTTGVFTFTDDGTQTGGLGTLRFYRLQTP